MYTIGDKIVYPMHGAGLIEDVEEKKILGETQRYYVLRVPTGDMKIMIPVLSANEIGVRAVINQAALQEVFAVLEAPTSVMPDNWNRRYRENMDKLKTGDIVRVAEVVRNLIRVDQVKKLSTGEKKMLTNARQILVSEISLCLDCRAEEAETRVLSSILGGA